MFGAPNFGMVGAIVWASLLDDIGSLYFSGYISVYARISVLQSTEDPSLEEYSENLVSG